MLRKINKRKFIKAYKAVNSLNKPISDTAKSGHINHSYLWRILTVGQKPEAVSDKIARRIGIGLGMTKPQSKSWVKGLLSSEPLQRINKGTAQSNTTVYKHMLHRHTHERPKHLPIVFYPAGQGGPSALAEHVQQIMSDKGMSIKTFTKGPFLNRRRMHDLFDGTQKTVSPLTCIRIADGLNIPSKSLLKYNHYKIKVKSRPLFKSRRETNDESLISMIKRLDSNDVKLVKSLVTRLLASE